MRGLSVTAARAIGALTMLVCIGAVRFADAAEIRVYCTGAPSVAAKIVAENFAGSTGHHLSFTVGQPATIARDLAADDQADVVIVPAPVAAKLTTSGALRTGSAVDLARVGIGVVVRAGARAPDISSASAIRKLLTNARSIVYPDPTSGGGSAGRAIAQMIDRMGLTNAVRPKLTRTAAIGGGVALVADGKAEVGLFNVSEILPIPGVTLVGPLPADLQSYIMFAAAIPAHNAAPEPAAAFIQALAAPAANEAWRKSGMEPVAAAKAQ
jgi:molybdate transport system substrate-binding protein